MKRPRLNLLVDVLAFAAFLLLTSTGVLLRLQLPPGSGGHVGQGSGLGAGQRTVLTLWGWSRHDWGTIHYWVACALLAVLAIHLLLHWKWVVCVVRGKPTDRSGLRLGFGALGLGALILLAFAPAVTPVTQQTRAELLQQRGAAPAETPLEQIRGSMTLGEISQLADVPVEALIKRLGLPENTPTTERIGRLLRSRGRHMDDVRKALSEIIISQSEQDKTKRKGHEFPWE